MHQTTMAAHNTQYYYLDPAFNAYFPHPNDLALAEYDANAARTTYLDREGFRHPYPVVGNSYILNDDNLEYTQVDLPSDIRAKNDTPMNGQRHNPRNDHNDGPRGN